MFQEITSFILKYNTTPTPDALKIEINSIRGSTDDTIKKIIEQIDEFGKDIPGAADNIRESFQAGIRNKRSDLGNRVQAALKEALKGRTSIVIAHRLSTIKEANQILVLNDGKIEQRGTHEELVEAGGLYSELYQRQDLSLSN